jgi:uncharacterized iron-regulated membrane protein
LPLRKLIFWTHLTAGVIAGLVILAMSLTGVLLAFQRQVLSWADRDLRATAADARRAPLAVSALVAAASKVSPDAKPSNVTVRSDPRAPATVAFGRERTLFVNRYTGAVLGEGAKGVRRFFRVNEDVHRWLALSGDSRQTGRKVTGISNLTFLFIVCSGLYIWIPKRMSRRALRNVTLFRGGLRGKARDFNWHNVLGIWSFLPLVAIVFSGVVMSFPWATALVYRAFGDEPPRAEGSAPPEGANRERAARTVAPPLDRLWGVAVANAAQAAPGWQSISVRLPLPAKGPVTFALDRGNGARPDKRSQLLLDPASGSVVEHKTYAKQTSGQRARAWLRFIHTGEAGGWTGQTVAALASAAAVVLVWTGIALALRRLRRWLHSRTQSTTTDANTAAEVEA